MRSSSFLKKILSPIGLIIAILFSSGITRILPLGMYGLQSIACPSDECHLTMQTEIVWTLNEQSNITHARCKCADGLVNDVSFWVYLLHGILLFSIIYVPIAWLRHRSITKRERFAAENENFEPSQDPLDDVRMGRVILIVLGIVGIVGFLFYISQYPAQ